MSSGPLSTEVKTSCEAEGEKQISQASTERMNSPTSCPKSSPPSSPPVVKKEAQQVMPSATRKRSHEEMNAQSSAVNDSSSTAVRDADGEHAQSKQDPNGIASAATVKPSTQAHTMPPPSAPVSSMLPPSQKPPRSGQGLANSQNSQAKPSKLEKASNEGPAKQGQVTDPDEDVDEDGISLNSPTLSDPQDKIEDFDWDDLQQRYHSKIAQLGATEQNILTEFGTLCEVSNAFYQGFAFAYHIAVLRSMGADWVES